VLNGKAYGAWTEAVPGEAEPQPGHPSRPFTVVRVGSADFGKQPK